MRKILIALFVCLTTESAGAVSLSEIHQMALGNDMAYAAAQSAWAAGQEALPQGRALLRPSLSFSAFLRRNSTETSAPASADYTSRGFGLNLTQPLYSPQDVQSLEQSRLAALLSDQKLRVAEQDLMLRVAQAYFDLLEAQDNLATAQSQKQAYAEQLAQARKSFEVGVATIVDTHEAQARYDLSQSQEIAALNGLEVKRRGLELLIGRDAPALDPLRADAAMPLPQPEDMDAWVRQAEQSSYAILTARTALESAGREVDKQRAGYRPTLDLVASYSDSRYGGSGPVDSKAGVLGVELAWPLYTGGATGSRVREAVAKQTQARQELDLARRQAALDTREAYLGVVSGYARVKALEQALVSGESQLKSTKLGLEVGVRTRVDVLNAQQQVYTTQRDLAAAKYQTLLAGLRLKAAAGSLAAPDMAAMDGLLRR